MILQNRSILRYRTMAAMAVAFCVPVLAAHSQAAAPGLDDPTIVAIFDAANTYDIETGSLGVRKGTTKEVRDFAAMLVRDHRAVRQQGRDLAASLKVTPTPPKGDFPLANAHVATMTSLRGLKSRAFDRAFLKDEVDFHNAVIDAVTQTLLPAIQNAQVKDLVTKVAPAFVAHRDRAQMLLDQLK
jgi:putative membrane protein